MEGASAHAPHGMHGRWREGAYLRWREEEEPLASLKLGEEVGEVIKVCGVVMRRVMRH